MYASTILSLALATETGSTPAGTGTSMPSRRHANLFGEKPAPIPLGRIPYMRSDGTGDTVVQWWSAIGPALEAGPA